MIWKLCWILLLTAVIVVVQSKTYIEVDEDGNEYEVKRFHVQGRQVNDTNSQCVVTRRRRDTNTARQYGNPDPIFTVTQEEENKEEESEDIKDEVSAMPQEAKDKKKDTLQADELPEDNEDDEDDVESTEIIAKPATDAPQVEVPDKRIEKPKKKEKLKKVTLIRPQAPVEEQEVDANEEVQKTQTIVQTIQLMPSSLVSSTAENSFVIIQAPQPEITKAPVQSAGSLINVMPTDQDYEFESQVLPFTWTYETKPTTTSAIWSTGDDVPNNAFNRINDPLAVDYATTDMNEEDGGMEEVPDDDLEAKPVAAARPRPNKSNKKKKKKKNKNKNKRPAKRPNRKRPRPNRKKQKKGRPTKQVVRRKHHNNNFKKDRVSNKRRTPNKPIKIRRGEPTNKTKKKQGNITTTSTITTTTDNDANIDCIIINKDAFRPSSTTSTTTTTTRRPFWNILGRQASSPGQPGEFGLRKRASLLFVA